MAASSGLAPLVSATGIAAGTYAQWLAYFEAQYQLIFGSDVYLGNDSQDVQLMSVFALACADACSSAIAVYNSFSPATAQGAGLSSVVKINGLARLIPTYSTVPVTITGSAGTVVSNGVVLDAAGNLWSLPATVTIPPAATITVTATCQTPGAISAASNTMTTLQSPILGVATVTNPVAASPGLPVETDAALRLRQAASVASPSQTNFYGMLGAVEAVPGVTRVRGVENQGAAANSYGVPAKSVDFIVEGGTTTLIAAALASRVAAGTQTYGTTSTTVLDASGSTRAIAYEIAVPAVLTVAMNVTMLPGWSSTTIALIQAALAAYIQALPIGSNLAYTKMLIPAYLASTPYFGTFEITSLTYSVNGGAAVSVDTQLAYNAAPTLLASAVTVTTH